MGIVAAGIAVVGGVVQIVRSAKQKKKAEEAIDAYDRQEITNVYEGLSVSTKGAELQREELARATATSIGALQQGGIRGVVGGIGKVQEQNLAASRRIGIELDLQQKEIDQLRAGDEARVQRLIEERERADLAGLGQQLAVGEQGIQSGIGTVASGAASFAGGGAAGAAGGGRGGGSFNFSQYGQTDYTQGLGTSMSTRLN